MKLIMSSRASILFVATFLWAYPSHAQGIIYVTSLEDKISETGGCSLQEAIFSANLDNNVAIDKYDLFDGTPHMITTQCAKGQGDDTIVLPTGATLLLDTVVDDPDNPTGPAATPMVTSHITIQAAGSTLQYSPNLNAPPCHFFAVAYPCVSSLRLFAIASNGYLKLDNANVKGFLVRGGNGGWNGGG